MKITVTDALQAEDSAEIRNHLMVYNHQFVGDIQNKNIGVFALDDHGNKIAGLTGSTVGRWISIERLWVSEALRDEGVGKQIIQEAERLAIAAGCRYARVDTFSFQARPFYEKSGYQLQMTLHDYPVEHERYFFTKTLTD